MLDLIGFADAKVGIFFRTAKYLGIFLRKSLMRLPFFCKLGFSEVRCHSLMQKKACFLHCSCFLVTLSLCDELTEHSAKKINKFILFCSRFFVTLRQKSRSYCHSEEKRNLFPLFFSRFFVTLSLCDELTVHSEI